MPVQAGNVLMPLQADIVLVSCLCFDMLSGNSGVVCLNVLCIHFCPLLTTLAPAGLSDGVYKYLCETSVFFLHVTTIFCQSLVFSLV